LAATDRAGDIRTPFDQIFRMVRYRTHSVRGVLDGADRDAWSR
jgi:hypothetical protein